MLWPHRAGYEPRRLFNVVQFVMNAPGGRSTVTLEDAMQIMYLRYGRQLLDSQARALKSPGLSMVFLFSFVTPHRNASPCARMQTTQRPRASCNPPRDVDIIRCARSYRRVWLCVPEHGQNANLFS